MKRSNSIVNPKGKSSPPYSTAKPARQIKKKPAIKPTAVNRLNDERPKWIVDDGADVWCRTDELSEAVAAIEQNDLDRTCLYRRSTAAFVLRNLDPETGEPTSRKDVDQTEVLDDATAEDEYEQYWVLDKSGKVIHRSESRAQAGAFADAFSRGCQVIGINRLAGDDSGEGDEAQADIDPITPEAVRANMAKLTGHQEAEIARIASLVPAYAVVQG